NNRFARQDTRHDAPRGGPPRTASGLGKGAGRSPNSNSTHSLALGNYKFAERCPAKVHRFIEQGIKDRGEVARRGIDDLQYLGGGSLSGQRILPLSSAFG